MTFWHLHVFPVEAFRFISFRKTRKDDYRISHYGFFFDLIQQPFIRITIFVAPLCIGGTLEYFYRILGIYRIHMT